MIRKQRIQSSKYTDLILVDFNNFLFKYIYGFDINLKKISDYTDTQHSIVGKEINFIQGIVDKLFAVKKKFKQSKMVICLDTPRKRIWRKRIYKQYKANRTYDAKAGSIDFATYFDLIRNRMNDIAIILTSNPDITITYIDKMEADDLIYFFVKKYNMKFSAIHILSNDGDLSQLEKYKNVHRYDKIIPNMKKLKQLDWKLYMLTKIIKGDAGDNIINIGSKWIFNPNFITYIINKTFDTTGELKTTDDVKKQLLFLEKNDIEKFNKIVYKFKKDTPKNNKIRNKKNIIKFKKSELDMFLNDNINIKEHLKNKYGEQIYKNYKFNSKLVMFDQIPKFLVKKCLPLIKFETNYNIDFKHKRMITLSYNIPK